MKNLCLLSAITFALCLSATNRTIASKVNTDLSYQTMNNDQTDTTKTKPHKSKTKKQPKPTPGKDTTGTNQMNNPTDTK